MLVTTELLQKFSGSVPENDTLQKIYIDSAHSEIRAYLGFDPETSDKWDETKTEYDRVFVSAVQFVCMEIATLMEMEENQNIGINNKSFGDSGSRAFLNVVDYSKYLHRLGIYKKGSALKV